MLGGIREDRHQLITKTKPLLLDLPTLGKITIVVVLCCSLPIGQHLDHIDEGHAVYSVLAEELRMMPVVRMVVLQTIAHRFEIALVLV